MDYPQFRLTECPDTMRFLFPQFQEIVSPSYPNAALNMLKDASQLGEASPEAALAAAPLFLDAAIAALGAHPACAATQEAGFKLLCAVHDAGCALPPAALAAAIAAMAAHPDNAGVRFAASCAVGACPAPPQAAADAARLALLQALGAQGDDADVTQRALAALLPLLAIGDVLERAAAAALIAHPRVRAVHERALRLLLRSWQQARPGEHRAGAIRAVAAALRAHAYNEWWYAAATAPAIQSDIDEQLELLACGCEALAAAARAPESCAGVAPAMIEALMVALRVAAAMSRSVTASHARRLAHAALAALPLLDPAKYARVASENVADTVSTRELYACVRKCWMQHAEDALEAALLAQWEVEERAACAAGASKGKSKARRKGRGDADAGGAGGHAGGAAPEAIHPAAPGNDVAPSDAVADEDGAAGAAMPSASAQRRRRRAATKAARRTGGASAGGGSAASAAESDGELDAAAEAAQPLPPASDADVNDALAAMTIASDAAAAQPDDALPPPSSAQLIESIFPWMRADEPQAAAAAPPAPAPAAAATPAAPAAPPPAAPQLAAVVAQLAAAEAALAKAEEEVDATKCVVCLDAQRSCVILPCKHLLLCASPACAAMLGTPARCPLCRVVVSDTMQLFV